MSALTHIDNGCWTTQQLALIKRTVAKDCTDDEFNLFVEAARGLRLNPLRRQIYCFVFSKDNPAKRRMSIVTAIDGMRAVAARHGDYRPDERAPRITIDPDLKDPATNPLGIVSAEVTVYRFAHGEWHPATGVAFWDEFAPLKEVWDYDPDQGKKAPTGRFELDKSGQWGRMGRVMIAKCAEAQALRRGWPDDLANVYDDSELDQARMIDITPSEAAANGETQARIEKAGLKDTILIDWLDEAGLQPVPLGKVADRVAEFLDMHRD